MKKPITFLAFAFPLLCVVILLSGGASFPTTRGVYVNTSGAVISPTNFWQSASNLIVTSGFRSEGSGSQSVLIGEGASVDSPASFGIAIGTAANAAKFGAVSIGTSSSATEWWAVSLGLGALASNTNTLALGHSTTASHTDSTAVGAGATTTATNQVMLGNSGARVDVPGTLRIASSFFPSNGVVLLDLGANIPTNAVPTGSASITNWLLTTIGGIPQLVATNHAAGGWLQKALYP